MTNTPPTPETGFIPACAGERPDGFRLPAYQGVHPRLRGGELSQHGTVAPVMGSSPPARGRVRRPLQPHLRLGFIPACAGESHP